jgi:hypothetical protein
MAFPDDWSYRKSVTLSRASGAVTNYQMKLLVGESSGAVGEDVDCGGLCKTDFSDLRFAKADGTTLLDYYIEDVTGATPNQLASIWIEFDSIGTGATTFYMYYGNAAASAVSSGVNTFLFFEDFNGLNDGDLNGQNGWTAHTTWDVATTTKYEGAKALASGAGGSTVNATHALSVGWNIFLQARMRKSQITQTTGLQIYLLELGESNTALSISTSAWSARTSAGWTAIGLAASPDTWYKARFAFDAKTSHKTWIDDTLYTPGNVDNATTIITAPDQILVQHYSAGGSAFADEIIVGQFLATGPAWGAWGNQEDLAAGSMGSYFFVMLLAGGGR